MAGLAFFARHWAYILSFFPPIILYLCSFFSPFSSTSFSCLEYGLLGSLLYYLCFIATIFWFGTATNLTGSPSIYKQLFDVSKLHYVGTIFFHGVVPLALFAGLASRHSTLLTYEFNSILLLGYFLFVSFVCSYHFWFMFNILVKKREFERMQDLHRLTKNVQIVYSKSADGEGKSLAQRRATELAADPLFEGFNVKVIAMDEFKPDDMMNNGAVLLLFILNPLECKEDMSDPLPYWLREEALVRMWESAVFGATKNIVYTREGQRRTCFLRIKYAVFAVPPTEPLPPIDIAWYIDNWMHIFGAHRMLPMEFGDEERFKEWTQNLAEQFQMRIANPDAVSEFVTMKRSPDPYLGWPEFTRWLDPCPGCIKYHQYEVTKFRERPTHLRVSSFHLYWWILTSSNGRLQYFRSNPLNKKAWIIGSCLFAAYALLHLGLYSTIEPSLDSIALLSSALLLFHVFYLIPYAKLYDRLRGRKPPPLYCNPSYLHPPPPAAMAVPASSASPAAGHAPISSDALDNKQLHDLSNTLHSPKEHFHTDSSHYHAEMRVKGLMQAENKNTPKSRKAYYGPIDNMSELMKIPFVSPLIMLHKQDAETFSDATTGTGTCKQELKLDDKEHEDKGKGKEDKKGGPKLSSDTNGDEQQTWIVNQGFEFQPQALVPYYGLWPSEFVIKSFPEEPLVWITNPVTYLSLPFELRVGQHQKDEWKCVAAAKKEEATAEESETSRPTLNTDEKAALAEFLQALQPGLPAPPLSEFKLSDRISRHLWQALKDTQVLVASNYWATEKQFWEEQRIRSRRELSTQGYTVLKGLIPPAQLAAFAAHNRRIWRKMGGESINEEMEMQKCQWNDEPVARYYNHQLTEFISEFVGEPLLHPGLALTLWIMKGDGFPMHTDSVPPFDLTLDLVVDHMGTCHRPVTFVRPYSNYLPCVQEKTLSLEVGEAVLFRGSEMVHYGGDLPAGHYHNVVLWTWSYVRD